MELLVLITLATLAVPLADREDLSPNKLNFLGALGGALKKIGKAALPIVGGIVGGPAGAAIGAAASSAIGGKDDGSTASTVGKIAGVALPAIQAFKSSRQAGKDSARSRELLDQAISLSTGEAERATQEFAANEGMRNEFRAGATNFRDTTNPLAQNTGGGGGVGGNLAGLIAQIGQMTQDGVRAGTAPKPTGTKRPTGTQGAANIERFE